MIRETFPVGMLRCNCSVLGDKISQEAIVVDPGADIPRILAVISKHGLTVKFIVITHAHIDHIAGALELKHLTGAPIFYNQQDLPLVAMMDMQASWLGLAQVPEVKAPDSDLAHGAKVEVAGLSAEILLTPGHTEGSLCVYIASQHLLLAGDTLFAGSVGRTDLPGGNSKTLIRSIHEHLLPLPDDTIVVPGHGDLTTIGAERENNPFLR